MTEDPPNLEHKLTTVRNNFAITIETKEIKVLIFS